MSKGSNLTEYVIPMAVLGIVVGIGLYNINSEGVLLKYFSSGAGSFDASTKKLSLGSADNTNANHVNTPSNSTITPAGEVSQPAEMPKSPVLLKIIDEGGQKVSVFDDGSLSFTVGGQNINLSPEIMSKQREMMMIGSETSGAAGASQLIKDIAYMIEQHKDDYPPGKVPVEISYGSGVRTHLDESKSIYAGSATVNSYQLKVGGHVLANQHDQACQGECKFQGDYRIEGQSDSTGAFKATVSTDSVYKNKIVTGNFAGNYANNEFNGNFSLDPKQVVGANYNWNIKFNETSKL